MTNNKSKRATVVSHGDKKYVIQDHSNLRLVFQDFDGEQHIVEPSDLCEAGWPCDDDGNEFDLIGYINIV